MVYKKKTKKNRKFNFGFEKRDEKRKVLKFNCDLLFERDSSLPRHSLAILLFISLKVCFFSFNKKKMGVIGGGGGVKLSPKNGLIK